MILQNFGGRGGVNRFSWKVKNRIQRPKKYKISRTGKVQRENGRAKVRFEVVSANPENIFPYIRFYTIFR